MEQVFPSGGGEIFFDLVDSRAEAERVEEALEKDARSDTGIMTVH